MRYVRHKASDCCKVLYSFLFGHVLLAFGGFTAKLAAAKGEQVEKHITLFPSLCSLRLCGEEIALRIARKQHSPVRRWHWPASFLWSSPANAGWAVRRIDSRYAADLHLSAYFPRPPPHYDFLVKIAFFRPLPRIYAECESFLRGKLFSAQA